MIMASGSSSNRWKLQDLQDLEQYGLAAELESTRLGGESAESEEVLCVGGAGGGMMGVEQNHDNYETYDMSDVLSELLTNDTQLFAGAPLPFSILNLESSPPPLLETGVTKQNICAVVKAPTAHGIKNTQQDVTYLNKGHSYELHVNYNGADHMTETMFKSVLLLTFSELRLKNCEEEQFEQWINDHPLERLLEMDNVGCDGLQRIENVEEASHMIAFTWSSLRPAVVAFRVNCLSSEFAARKHGGEKGIPLCIQLDTFSLNNAEQSPAGKGEMVTLTERLVCNVKVFKDKGADRKQRQEQLKIERMLQQEQANYRRSQNVTPLHQLILPVQLPESPQQQATPTTTQTPDMGTPYQVTTPTCPMSPAIQSSEISNCSSVELTHAWLSKNRFGQFVSLFANYTGQDLLRLSRRDLVELCGAPDGIRLYNALRATTVRVVYITMGTEKVCHAVCLESLTAHELGCKVADRLNIPPASLSSLVRLTASGVLVLIEDNVVQNMRDEECFQVQAVKQEGGQYQVILQDHTPSEHSISFRGTEVRH